MTTQLVEDVVAAEHAPALAGQQVQQFELGAGEFNLFALAHHTAARRVDGQAFERQHVGRRCAVGRSALAQAAAQQGLDVGDEFARFEGFGQVGVGAQLQAHHTVHHVTARGEHDDGNVALLADGAAEFKAVHLGQHHVEDGGIEHAAAQARQALAGLERLREIQLEPPKVGGQRRPELFVVVNQQYTVHAAFSHCGALDDTPTQPRRPQPLRLFIISRTSDCCVGLRLS